MFNRKKYNKYMMIELDGHESKDRLLNEMIKLLFILFFFIN